MQVTRSRLCVLASLVVVYLGAVLFLSVLTLHEAAPNGLRQRSLFKTATYVPQKPRQHYQTSLIEAGGGFGDGKSLRNSRHRIRWCSALRFREPAGDSVALASFPGSGNTWLRYLLQQATGILTGSVYKDYGLLKNGFPAENTTNGSVLVVKTHEWGGTARAMFKKAVLLVRAPAAAIQAEFNRQSGGHVGFAAPERYKRTKGKYWEQFVHSKLYAWRKTNLDWLNNFEGPTHVVFYEQLVENPERSLKALLDFLDVKIDQKQFQCALERKEGIYRRKKRILNFDPFNDEMKRKIAAEQTLVYESIYRMASPAS